MAPPSLREYLEKYKNGYEEERGKEVKPDAGNLIVIDDDPVWQKSVKIEENDKPVVKEDQGTVKRPFGVISDGPKNVQNLGSSPPCKDISQPKKLRPEMPVINQRPKPLAGLVTAKDFKDEIARTRKEEWLW